MYIVVITDLELIITKHNFKLYALSVSQLNPSGTKKAAIEAAMADKILGQTELMGTYTYTP
jgi:phosphatidylethanolamine-binding protein (PEBP) family uncharacterized protein